MAIQTPRGYQISPIAMMCATVCFLGVIACFVIFVLFGNVDNTRTLGEVIRPLIPVLASVGSALVVYIKLKSTSQINTQQNIAIAERADTIVDKSDKAASLAAEAAATVSTTFNGDLDQRIAEAVAKALAARDQESLFDPENEDNSNG